MYVKLNLPSVPLYLFSPDQSPSPLTQSLHRPGFHRILCSFHGFADIHPQNISVYIRGNYSSPARTATHIHQAVKGRSGPPRIAFPNPQPLYGEGLEEFSWRYSLGCQRGPFTTGILVNGSECHVHFAFLVFPSDVNTQRTPVLVSPWRKSRLTHRVSSRIRTRPNS